MSDKGDMEGQNSNPSISSIFKDNADGGWIITKNEKGKVKVARCAEDELDDLYTTRTDWLVKTVEETEESPGPSDKVPDYRLRGTAMFLIRDLLNCQKVEHYFVCKDIPFLNVLLCGTVVSCYTSRDKYVFVVDDGTSSISCLIKQQELADLQLSQEQKERHAQLTQEFLWNPDDPLLKAKVIMMRALKRLLKNTPTFEDLHPGNVETTTLRANTPTSIKPVFY